MKYVTIFLEAHQPRRLREYRFADIGRSDQYFWDERNHEIIDRVSDISYIPTLELLSDLKTPISLSFSGILLEELYRFRPEVVDLLKDYLKSSGAELVLETYYHSLSSIWNPEGFFKEVEMDRDIKKGITDRPFKTFRNTEMIFNDSIDSLISNLNISNVLTEGTDFIIGNHNPNYKYSTVNGHNLFLRNYRLSDDISFRFSTTSWNEYPLFSEKYLTWLSQSPGDVINIFMDFETFGEHQRKETGIFDFIRSMIEKSRDYGIEFITVENVSEKLNSSGIISISDYISWADIPRDLSAWIGNELQRDAFEILKSLKDCVPYPLYGYLSASDHLYYMSLGTSPDMVVHDYFNPYGSPYDAYITFRNIMEDLRLRYCNRNDIM